MSHQRIERIGERTPVVNWLRRFHRLFSTAQEAIDTNAAGIATNTTAIALINDGEAWLDWTPVLKQGATITTTVIRAKYVIHGTLLTLHWQLTATSAGTAANAIELSGFPVDAVHAGGVVGHYYYFDSGNTIWTGVTIGNTVNATLAYHDGDGNALGISSHTVANTDFFSGMLQYEIAP